jgi:hypothetical protein
MRRQPPTLQYLCLKKLWQENPVRTEKMMAKLDFMFGDWMNVLEKEKQMRQTLENQICSSGQIVKETVVELIQNKMPNVYKIIILNYLDLQSFYEDLIGSDYNEVQVIYNTLVSELVLPCQTIYDSFRLLKIKIRKVIQIDDQTEDLNPDAKRYHTVEIDLDITSFSEDTVMSAEYFTEMLECDQIAKM